MTSDDNASVYVIIAVLICVTLALIALCLDKRLCWSGGRGRVRGPHDDILEALASNDVDVIAAVRTPSPPTPVPTDWNANAAAKGE